MQGLIIENISNMYKIKTNSGIYEAVARGKFKQGEVSPVVGDTSRIQIIDEEKKQAVIEDIEPRKNYNKRPKISNITQMILVLSSKDPKPDLLMLDKQLAYAEFQEIKPVIVLNKIDLDSENEFKKIRQIYNKIGYEILETEAKNQKGIGKLKKVLKNNINVFSGNSGVGKSTLINAIFNEEMTLEGEISKKNKRGKNTTTSVKLYEIDENTYIADTPGFSTFDVSEIHKNDLCKYFVEFKKEINNCKYTGCTHIKEESCGIKKAVQEGKVSEERYERFIKIYNELNN